MRSGARSGSDASVSASNGENTALNRFGLCRHRDHPGELLLERGAEALDANLLAVWRGKSAVFLESPSLGCDSPAVLNDPRYTHYTSVGQQQAVRTVLTSPRDKTLLVNLPTGAGKHLLFMPRC